MFFKKPKDKKDPFGKVLRSLSCCNCGENYLDVCGAHIGIDIPYEDKGGMGAKNAHRWQTPLCHKCHIGEQHQKGERSFWGDRNPHQLATNLWTYYIVVIKGEQKGKVTEDNIRVMNNIIRQWKRHE